MVLTKDSFPWSYHAKVVNVVDGDTIDVDVDMGFHIFSRQRLRLIKVNAPELSTTDGRFVKTVLSGLLTNKSFTIYTLKPDKYGRYLFDLWLSEELGWLSEWMLKNKYAVPY